MGIEMPISEAKAKLTELVRRAEAGEDIALTRHGQVAVRLVAGAPAIDRERRQRVFDELARRAALRAPPVIKAEFSADFLYDSNGLPA